MKKFTIVCIALALSAGPALAERVGYRPEMNDCQKGCVDTYGPKVDSKAEGRPASGESFGQHRQQTLAAIEELNACLKACESSQNVVAPTQDDRRERVRSWFRSWSRD